MYTIYKNFNIQKELNHVTLSAESIKVLEVAKDDFVPHRVSCPSVLLNIISPRLDLSKYDKYIVYTLLVTDYNRVTDYKKIWGLKNIDNGIYDNNYLIDSGKVYFGIAKSDESEIKTPEISIYVMNGTKIDFDEVFQIFKDNSFIEFVSKEQYNVVSDRMRRLISDSIVIYFDYSKEALHIFKNGIENNINEQDLPLGELIIR